MSSYSQPLDHLIQVVGSTNMLRSNLPVLQSGGSLHVAIDLLSITADLSGIAAVTWSTIDRGPMIVDSDFEYNERYAHCIVDAAVGYAGGYELHCTIETLDGRMRVIIVRGQVEAVCEYTAAQNNLVNTEQAISTLPVWGSVGW
jgi:hypothetical protein